MINNTTIQGQINYLQIKKFKDKEYATFSIKNIKQIKSFYNNEEIKNKIFILKAVVWNSDLITKLYNKDNCYLIATGELQSYKKQDETFGIQLRINNLSVYTRTKINDTQKNYQNNDDIKQNDKPDYITNENEKSIIWD